MLRIFSCADWPFIYLLWRNVFLNPLPILKLDCFFFVVVEFWEFFSYQIYDLQMFSMFLWFAFLLGR